MRTQEEIDLEIKRLEVMKPHVRQYSAFGGDNHILMGIEIKALKADEDISEYYDDHDQNSSAYSAFQWKQGEDVYDGETPSQGWEGLCSLTAEEIAAKL